MMKSWLNLRFFLLFLLFSLLTIITRLLFITEGFDLRCLAFFSGLFVIPLIYYLLLSFSFIKHRLHGVIILIGISVLLQLILYYDFYDNYLYYRIAGFVFSIVLISITFFGKLKKWFLYQ